MTTSVDLNYKRNTLLKINICSKEIKVINIFRSIRKKDKSQNSQDIKSFNKVDLKVCIINIVV